MSQDVLACPVLVIPRPAPEASQSASGVHNQRRIEIKINHFNGHDSRGGILPTVGLIQEIEDPAALSAGRGLEEGLLMGKVCLIRQGRTLWLGSQTNSAW